MLKRYIPLFLIMFLCSFDLLAQDMGLLGFNEERLQIQQTGMLTLGGWALGNMAVNGALLINPSSNEQAHFYRMNIFWNLVNLGLAIPGYLSAVNADPAALNLAESAYEFNKMNKILLVNVGLDVAYITGGFLLKEAAKTRPDKQDMFKGYGRSLILQGAFLFAFDVALVAILESKSPQLNQLLEVVSFNGSSLALTFRF
jgi:hypothetical protein